VTLVTLADVDVYDAIEASVVAMLDNPAEQRVMKETLKAIKDEVTYGRMV
jgi:hypothetical protein